VEAASISVMALGRLPDYTASLCRIRYCYYYYCHQYQNCDRLQVARPGPSSLERLAISLSTAHLISTEGNNALHSTRNTKRTEREAKRSFRGCTHIRNKRVHFNIILPTLSFREDTPCICSLSTFFRLDIDLIFLDMITPINRGEGCKLRQAPLWQCLLPPGAALIRHRAVFKCPQEGFIAK
jgi:hypothetical protein